MPLNKKPIQLHPRALQGIDLFNKRHFFEAHEALEDAWRISPPPERDFYRGILQIAVMYYKIEGNNFIGAVKLFRRQEPWMQDIPDNYLDVDVHALKQDTQSAFEAIVRLGANRLSQFDWSTFSPIRFIPQ